MSLFKCRNSTKNKDCDLVNQIKTLQKELEITENNIEELLCCNDCSFPTIAELFSNPRWRLRNCYSYYGFEERRFNTLLYNALTNISKDKYQKIIEEIVQVETITTTLRNERKKEQELTDKINKCKDKLGIK